MPDEICALSVSCAANSGRRSGAARVCRWRGPFVALVTLFGIACAPNEVTPTVDCSTATVPTYSQLAIWSTCTDCHAKTASGGARQGAPSDVNFDTYQAATASAEKAAATVNGGSMPPGNERQPTTDQKTALYAWALCGTPN